jgi:hypothetical protein
MMYAEVQAQPGRINNLINQNTTLTTSKKSRYHLGGLERHLFAATAGVSGYSRPRG